MSKLIVVPTHSVWIGELVTDTGVTTFDVFAPPSTNVVDGIENFLRGLVDDK
jgi:hypothetical protein